MSAFDWPKKIAEVRRMVKALGTNDRDAYTAVKEQLDVVLSEMEAEVQRVKQ